VHELRGGGGVEALRVAGIVDLKDPTVLYTNKFLDQALSG